MVIRNKFLDDFDRGWIFAQKRNNIVTWSLLMNRFGISSTKLY